MSPKIYLFLLGLGLTVLVGFLVISPFPKVQVAIQHFQQKYLTRSGNRVIPLPEPAKKMATIEFVGDIMLARSVEESLIRNGQEHSFALAGDLLMNNDLLIGNFEGTVREKQHIEKTNEMFFDTTPDNVPMLAEQGFDLLSLSNNHADDFGRATAELTRQTITAAGMTPFGDAWDSGSFVAHKTVNGIPFAFIGYHEFNEKTDGVVEAIKNEKAAGNFVIVFAHWGVEYEHEPSSSQVFAAHQFIDAGADTVIGAHPHVIETVETYKNVPIVYSLGNFLFDQDWSEETKRGMTVRLTVEEDKLSLSFQPLYLQKWQMQPATGTKKQEMLDALGVPTGALELTR